MKLGPTREDLGWMAAGAAALVAVTLVVLHFHEPDNTAAAVAAKAKRVDTVEEMRVALAAAAEAGEGAVLAVTDEDALAYADQARAATERVAAERQTLARLTEVSGTPQERALLEVFDRQFAQFRKIDDELLALAVKNTNLKAYALAFGPAADALQAMSDALSRVVAAAHGSAEELRTALLAFGAQSAALRIQTKLAPHIAEASDAKMDALEAQMEALDHDVRQDLDGLAALEKPEGDADLDAAISSYARFSELRAQIIALSRENTEVRATALSLNEKRTATLDCAVTLSRLQQEILGEPVADVDYGPPESPR